MSTFDKRPKELWRKEIVEDEEQLKMNVTWTGRQHGILGTVVTFSGSRVLVISKLQNFVPMEDYGLICVVDQRETTVETTVVLVISARSSQNICAAACKKLKQRLKVSV